ncbi:hypothetical protein SRABI112_05101 [Pseudomonas mediterranea]|nr:hypothetical protein SRABI112_05101 [Pseudomonas mediterranea]
MTARLVAAMVSILIKANTLARLPAGILRIHRAFTLASAMLAMVIATKARAQ